MVVFTVQRAKKLFQEYAKGVLDFTVQNRYASKEYCVEGQWSSNPQGQIRGVRYSLDTIALESVASVWDYIQDRSKQNPTQPNKVLEDLTSSRLEERRSLILFSPWGPRYFIDRTDILNSDPEVKTLEEVKEVLSKFDEEGLKYEWLLMPADVYGTDINNLNVEFVKEYFKNLEREARRRINGINVVPWSEIRRNPRYKELKKQISENLKDLINPGTLTQAVSISKKFGSSDPLNSAKSYCTERLVEGILIDEIYNPLKLSLVRKEKDVLDGPLKRIYIIKNKAPWLGMKDGN